MFTYQGKTALITGASSGIGATFARELAAKGMNVILVARSEEKLLTQANEIADQFHVRAEVIAIDLGHEGAAQEVYEEVQRRDMSVDLLSITPVSLLTATSRRWMPHVTTTK